MLYVHKYLLCFTFLFPTVTMILFFINAASPFLMSCSSGGPILLRYTQLPSTIHPISELLS